MLRAYSFRILFFCSAAAITILAAAIFAAPRQSTLVLSEATLLSRGLSDCVDPATDLSDCSRGVAAVDAYVRHWIQATPQGETLFVPSLDRNSPFVQMHRLGWAVNKHIMTSVFNYSGTGFLAPHSLGDTTRDVSGLKDTEWPFLLSNIVMAPDNQWNPYSEQIHFDTRTRIAIIKIGSGSQPNSFDSLKSVAAALSWVKAASGYWLPVILWDDSTVPVEDFLAFVSNSSNVALKPAMVIELENDAVTMKKLSGSGIYHAGQKWDDDLAHRYTLEWDDASGAESIASASRQDWKLRDLPAAFKDAHYVSKLVAIRAEAVAAAANDPVVGSTGFMPFTRSGNFRMCYRGECESGNLWTDALRWKVEKIMNDKTTPVVAIEGSGGLRGLGWPAGEVKTSRLWEMLPFVNQLCSAKISGVKLWELFNYSIAMATFTSTKTETGDRLMQVSGAKIVYNTLLPGGAGKTKLVSIDVLDPKTGEFAPLERTRLYTVATNSFVCGAFDPYPSFLSWKSPKPGPYMKGAVSAKVTDDTVQQIVADYLGTFSAPRPTLLEGRLVNDTEGVAMASMVQSKSECSGDSSWWDDQFKTCRACSAGEKANADGDGCETDILTVALAIAIPVAVLIIIAVVVYILWHSHQVKKNIRNVDNAPKTGPCCIIFTDVEGSTKQWSSAPQSMSAALETSFKLMRDLAARENIYEVKSAGDSLMLAASSVEAAVRFSLDTQRVHMAAQFPRAINAVYSAADDEQLLDIDDDPDDLVSGPDPANVTSSNCFSGLRIRIGISYAVLGAGQCDAKFDEQVKGFDYFGPAVNLAARTEASARGGQVLVGPHVKAALDDAGGFNAKYHAQLTPAGEFTLKGVMPAPTALFQIMPNELAPRSKHFIASGRATAGSPTDKPFSDNLSEVASSMGDSENSGADVGYDEDRDFLRSMLKTCKQVDKRQILSILENSWRIRAHSDLEKAIDAVARRVSKVKLAMVQQEERKAAQGLGVPIPKYGADALKRRGSRRASISSEGKGSSSGKQIPQLRRASATAHNNDAGAMPSEEHVQVPHAPSAGGETEGQ